MKAIALSIALVCVVAVAHADLRSEAEASNKRMTVAMKKKDFATIEKEIRKGTTANFVYIEEGAKGKPQKVDEMMKNIKMGLGSMSKVTVCSAKTLSLTENGKIGAGTTEHKMGGIVIGGDKKPHEIVMMGVSMESYVKEKGVWKISKMVWKNTGMTMDGKKMDPAMMGMK